jgi:hypothetical protein
VYAYSKKSSPMLAKYSFASFESIATSCRFQATFNAVITLLVPEFTGWSLILPLLS